MGLPRGLPSLTAEGLLGTIVVLKVLILWLILAFVWRDPLWKDPLWMENSCRSQVGNIHDDRANWAWRFWRSTKHRNCLEPKKLQQVWSVGFFACGILLNSSSWSVAFTRILSFPISLSWSMNPTPSWNPTPCFYSAQRECWDDAGEPREMLTLSRRTSGLLPHWGLSRLAGGLWAPMEGRPHVRQGELVFFHLACVWLQERWR